MILRLISETEFEQARIAFVTTWDAIDQSQQTPPGVRSRAGLEAALGLLGIGVAKDSMVEDLRQRTEGRPDA